MFAFKARSYLSELQHHHLYIYNAYSNAMFNVDLDLDFIRIDEKSLSVCPAESIDYAVMEKLPK